MVDLSLGKVVKRVSLPALPPGTKLPDLSLVTTIPVGTDPNWIAFNHDDEFAYVTNRGSDNLSVISVKEMKEVARVPTGTYPPCVICIPR